MLFGGYNLLIVFFDFQCSLKLFPKEPERRKFHQEVVLDSRYFGGFNFA